VRKILVRFPNWLGDLVMSLGFYRKLKEAFPDAKVYAITKAEISELLYLFGKFEKVFGFSKTIYRGLMGIYRFSLSIKDDYDVYFSLPDSFSSAILGFLSGSKERVGYKAELRDFLLTKSYKKPENMHRVEAYAYLLKDFHKNPLYDIKLEISVEKDREILELKSKYKIGVNINSEAQSRRMSHHKWVKIISEILNFLDCYIILTGSKKDEMNVKYLEELLREKIGMRKSDRIINLAGKTNLIKLSQVMKALDLFISTDSGPAHLSNALSVPTIALLGAGDEKITGPYNRDFAKIIRLDLECSPCRRNECKFGTPKCLEQIEERVVVETALRWLEQMEKIN